NQRGGEGLSATLLRGVHSRPLHLIRSAGAGRSEEQLRTVGQRKIAPVGAVGSVFGLITVNVELLAYFQRVLGNPSPHKNVRAAGLDCPVLDCSVRLLHIDIVPAMWID